MKVFKTDRNLYRGEQTKAGRIFSCVTTGLLILILASCENFLGGSSLKKVIEDEISYAKASSFVVRVAADNGTGTIVSGAGDKTVKVTDSINLEFDVSDSYKFLYWTAIEKDTGADLSDSVDFSPVDRETTVVTILKEGNILIKPVCAVRPAVADFFPRDNYSGEPKNSTILITFNHELSSDNDLSKISVSINGDSILHHFKRPEIDGKSIKILPDNLNPLPDFEGTKVITVRIPYNFFYEMEDGTIITIGESNYDDIAVSYTINSSTNEKSRINFQAPLTEAGIMTPTGSDSYSLGKVINLEFKEKAEYKFCGWNIENGSDVVEIADTDSAVTTLKVLEASTTDVIVTPKVYKRPSVSGFTPDTVSANATSSVPKDSDIKITFTEALSADNDLSDISITINGDDVSSNFEEPELEGKVITIKAKMDAPSLVSSGTRTVTVRIPSRFYYVTEDGYAIEAGSEDIQQKYTINTNSKVQAKVDFSMTADSGILSRTGTETYNYNDEVEISFTENDAYQFVKWELQNDKLEDGTVVVTAGDVKSQKTTLKVKGKTENKNVIVKAVCEKRPVVSDFSPVNTAVKPSVAKNSPISITFSKKLELTEAELERIQITIGDGSVKDNFKAARISGDAVIFEADNENLIDLKSGTKTVTVTIPGDFYYLANKTEEYAGDKIYIGKDVKKTYVINSETTVRPKVSYKVLSDSQTAVEGGKITPSGTAEYNYGDQVAITFKEKENYQFLRWESSASDKIIIEDVEASETKVTVKSTEQADYEVRAICAERPSVTEFSPVISAANPSVAKNSPINITFSKKLELTDADLKRIKITINGDDAKEHFKTPTVSNATVIFEADNDNLIDVKSGTKTVTVTIPEDFYYLNSDGIKVFTGKEIKKTYEINTRTTVVPTVTFSLAKADSGKITPSGTVEYNYGDTVNLSFEEDSKYKFLRWESSDQSKIQVKNLESSVTTVNVKSTEQASFTVSAICAERPSVTSFAPDTSASSSESVPKDRDIEITFSKALSTSTDLREIKVYMDAINVDEYFADRVLDGTKVTLKADITKQLPVSSGTKNITVIIPGDFSYVYKDGSKNVNVSMGNSVSMSYRVNSRSKYQTTLSLSSDTSEGTIEPSGQQTFNYGDIVSLKFTEKTGYKFLHWETNATSGVLIGNANSPETTVTIKRTEEASGLYIRPVCVERPAVTAFSPNTENSGVTSFSKDSDIEIVFNNPLSASNDLSKITVFMDGYSIDEYFETRSITGNTVTLKADKNNPIPLTAGTKNIIVTVPADLFYEYGDDKVQIETGIETVKKYKINTTSCIRAKLNFTATNGATVYGSIEPNGQLSYNYNDVISLKFTEGSQYQFTGWRVENGAGVVSIEDASSKETTVTIIDSTEENQIVKISPVCVERTKLNISFIATHGNTIPSEDKSYYSGNTFNLRYSEDGDYAFTGWKVIDAATNLEVNDVLKFDNDGKDVMVEVLKTDMSVKIIAENGERPVVMDFVPGFKNEGVYIDSMLKFIFNKAMDASSIYWTKEELSEMGITEDRYDLYPAEVDGNTIKNSDEEILYYAYRNAGDESGSSLVYKNYTMNIRGTTENLLSHYGCPYFDVTKAILNVPVNQSNLPPKITEIEFKISKDMISSEGISLKSSFQKFYFTGATIDNDPPDFVTLEVEQLLENGSWTKVEKKDNVDHTKPNNFKLLNIGAKDLKVKVKGVVTDTGSKPAKLKVFLDPLYTDYYDGQQKIEVGEKSLPSAGAIAEFPEGIEFDFSEKDIPQGIYLLSVAAVDNAGKEKVESFKMVYDYTPPEVSELTYVSTYAQDRLTVGRRNETRDIYKTEIIGFKDNSIKTVTRDENIELIGLAGAAPSRTHTITLKEYDYLGNYATYTKVVQAIPEPGMYYFSDDYWTKDSSRRYTTVIGAGGYEFNREIILWGIITSQGFGKNKNEYTNVRVLEYNAGFRYFYGSRNIAPWDDDEMKGSDGLKDLKYVIDNCDYQKLRDETKTIDSYPYSTIWSVCDYEKKIYVPGDSELVGIFAEDKRMFNEAVAAYDGGVTANRIRDDEFYFSSTPYYNTAVYDKKILGGTEGKEWFWCVYSGSSYKAGMMKKDKSSGSVHSRISQSGVETVTGAYLKLVRQVNFD